MFAGQVQFNYKLCIFIFQFFRINNHYDYLKLVDMSRLNIFKMEAPFLTRKGLTISIGIVVLLGVAAIAAHQATPTNYRFDFGSGKVASGYTQVKAGELYSKETGYGFEPGSVIQEVDRGGDPLTGDFVTSETFFKFSVALPEGNYKVTVTLGDASGESITTVKSETRRLMLERIATAKGKFETLTFLVNTRSTKMSPGNELKLDSREWNPQTKAVLSATWDDKLTLQFSDERPCLCAIEIVPADSTITVFIIGDSTVTDQQGDGSGSWGQNLARWFGLPVAIANHAESGQTLKAFRFQHRWEKLMDLIKPGDYVFMQFGHNDSKKSGHDPMWPADDKAGDWAITHSDANTDYKWGLASNAAEIMRHGGIPVIVSPITRLDKVTGQVNSASHGDYPKAAKEAAELAGCAFIDLFSMSIETMKALGPLSSPAAYADGTHTSSYGGYLYSRCVVEGIKKANLDLARYLTGDAGVFDPSHPTPLPADFKISYDRRGSAPSPSGNGPRRGR
jgi:lysophospholipase L1-like esterase